MGRAEEAKRWPGEAFPGAWIAAAGAWPGGCSAQLRAALAGSSSLATLQRVPRSSPGAARPMKEQQECKQRVPARGMRSPCPTGAPRPHTSRWG